MSLRKEWLEAIAKLPPQQFLDAIPEGGITPKAHMAKFEHVPNAVYTMILGHHLDMRRVEFGPHFELIRPTTNTAAP